MTKITTAAHGIKADGDTRPLHILRADLATRLLQGIELPDAIRALLVQAGDETTPPALETSDLTESTAGNATVLAGSAPSGELSADAGIAVLADEVNRRLNHVRARFEPRELPHAIRRAAQRIHGEFAEARDAACQGDDEVHGRPGYRPSAALRREVEARHATCVFPSCNQPSHRCDLDHTIPWRPGITCRCNLAPLCRRHHRLKQRTDWRLFQIWAGLLLWVTPSGAWYIVRPDRQ